MSAKAVQCQHCGAVMTPAADGRTYQCRYCGAQILVQVDAEQIAAGMRLDLSNAAAFLQHLAHTLESAFAERTRVHRQGSEVLAVEITLDPDLFVARREAHGVVAHHKRMVRGVALKTTPHALDQWVHLLHRALAAHANEGTREAAAIASLFGKP